MPASITNDPSSGGQNTSVPVVVPTDSVVAKPVVAPVVKPVNAPVNAPAQKSKPAAEFPRDVSWIWDIPFDKVTMDGAISRINSLIARGVPSYVVTANLNYAMLHHREEAVAKITYDADLILPDGQPIVWRSQLTGDPLPERVAGSEMIYRLAENAAKNFQPIYFLGGEPGVARQCAEKLTKMYPSLLIAGVESPPFRPLTAAEEREQFDRIRNSGAKILLVAFGQPKGELWIHHHYKQLGIPVTIQLGASFDFIAGTAKRAPRAFQKYGMEWFYRMTSDPKRLVPRYARNACFLFGRLINDWQRKVEQWGMNPNSRA